MHVDALDIVEYLIEEHCKNLYVSLKLESSMILQHKKQSWTRWIIIAEGAIIHLAKNTKLDAKPEMVKTIFGRPVSPIELYDPNSTDQLIRLIKKLDVILQ